jgi:hypothetical protein
MAPQKTRQACERRCEGAEPSGGLLTTKVVICPDGKSNRQERCSGQDCCGFQADNSRGVVLLNPRGIALRNKAAHNQPLRAYH